MVTLIYHKRLDDVWQQAAQQLRVTLAKAPSCKTDRVTIIGRSRKQKVTLDCDHVMETLQVGDQQFRYKQVCARARKHAVTSMRPRAQRSDVVHY